MSTVTLNHPIKRNKKEIKTVTITDVARQAGSLRGLNLQAVLTSDYDALLKWLPRITEPALTEAELTQMDTWDFINLTGQAAAFLQGSSTAESTTTADALSSDAVLPA